MVTTESTMTDIVVQRTRTRYHWPAMQLNFWLLIMIVGASTILGIFAYFLTVQQQLELGIPWYFTYWITTAAISLLFIFAMLYLISQRQLLPGIVILGSFMLFVLWLVGLIVISIELWGSSGVNGTCQLYLNGAESKGPNTNALAYLQQHSICQSWTAAWAFELIGCIFLLWMMIMAYQVHSDL